MAKSFLVVKADREEESREHFAGTSVSITTGGTRHRRPAIGPRHHTAEYVTSIVRKWLEEIKLLADIAQSQPYVAYCAYGHGLSSRWSFLSRTIPDIADLLQPLEDTVQHHLLLPALTACSREMRDLLALPVCLRKNRNF